ncbi:K(+)-transporting ATPase subunit F [Leptospira fletcheri]
MFQGSRLSEVFLSYPLLATLVFGLVVYLIYAIMKPEKF